MSNKIKMSKELWQHMQETHVGQVFGLWPENLRAEFKILWNNKDIKTSLFEGLQSGSIDYKANWAAFTFTPRISLANEFVFHFSSDVQPDFEKVLYVTQEIEQYLIDKSWKTTFEKLPSTIRNLFTDLRKNEYTYIQYLEICQQGENVKWVTPCAKFSGCSDDLIYRLAPDVKLIIIKL